jgi:hypothetical protein
MSPVIALAPQNKRMPEADTWVLGPRNASSEANTRSLTCNTIRRDDVSY